MGKSKGGTSSFRYGFGIHMGLARGPLNAITEIRIGDKVAWTGNQTGNGQISIDKKELFGGDKQEGGVYGKLDVMMGGPDQPPLAALASMLKHAVPAFRTRATVFFDGILSSNTPYPKVWKFRVNRTTAGWEKDTPWYPEKCRIDLIGGSNNDKPIIAMNPAHIIYEVLTNHSWGRGLDPAAIDNQSFVTAANTLYDEGLGLCLRWTRQDSISSFIQSVLDHIGAVLYSDRQTGLTTLKLIRYDYYPDELPIYDTNSGLLSIDDASVSAMGAGINEVRVTYKSPIDGQDHSISAQNLAAFQANQGRANAVTKSYPGFPTAALALRAAQRDLRMNATALRRFQLTMDRRAWKIPPAGVFRLRDTQRGIDNMILRVGRIDDGTLASGKIKITCVQDVFGFPLTSFVNVEKNEPVKPETTPILKRRRIIELPYGILNRFMTPADFAHVEDDNGYVGALVEKPSPMSAGYDFKTRDGYSEDEDLP